MAETSTKEPKPYYDRQWQYMRCRNNYPDLEKLGREAWELVNVVPLPDRDALGTHTSLLWIFKRQIRKDEVRVNVNLSGFRADVVPSQGIKGTV